jgi:hypothetical protein
LTGPDFREESAMAISPELQSLINSGLDELHRSEGHILGKEIRHSIYSAICPDIEAGLAFIDRLKRSEVEGWPNGYRKFACLVLLTAKHAFPIFEEYTQQIETDYEPLQDLIGLPKRIMEVAEAVASGNFEIDEAARLLSSDFYLGTSGICDAFSYPVSCAGMAASGTLDMALYGYRGDVARHAVEAYSAIDENPRGVWFRNFYPIDMINPIFYASYFLDEATIKDRKTGYPSIYQPPIPIRYDLQKRFDFWEWWLTEAIVKACETEME